MFFHLYYFFESTQTNVVNGEQACGDTPSLSPPLTTSTVSHSTNAQFWNTLLSFVLTAFMSIPSSPPCILMNIYTQDHCLWFFYAEVVKTWFGCMVILAHLSVTLVHLLYNIDQLYPPFCSKLWKDARAEGPDPWPVKTYGNQTPELMCALGKERAGGCRLPQNEILKEICWGSS